MLFPSDSVNDLLCGASAVIQPTVIAAALHYAQRKKSWQSIWFAQPRQRVSVFEVFTTMGPRIFCRAFRMTFDGFWRLHAILLPHICTAIRENRHYTCKGGREGGDYSFPPIPNGSISSSIRLGAAIRYFAGGSPYDIVCMFGISYSEVMSSVWIIVHAINTSLLRLHRRRNVGIDLPRARLFQMIVDGHWQRPTRQGSNRQR